MKNNLILLIINLFLIICEASNDNNKNLFLLLNNQTKNFSNLKNNSRILYSNEIRNLENEDSSFKNIRIFIDKTYIIKNSDNSALLNKVIFSLEKCVKAIEEIIKVQQLDKIKFTNNEINKLGFSNDEVDSKLLPSGEGISSDLIIFPKFEEIQQKSQLVLAKGKPMIFDPITNRPIGAILSINKILPSIPNSFNYFESVIIHQITHILGFMYELFDKFPIGFDNVIKTENETRTNNEKKFIISPKVVEYAKKYFNCDSITGVELEDTGGYDNYNNSHWEARILLGEYMNSEVHTPEQAISGFTLALLEDSGWYKTNMYTGGLMRYGKYQGCDFLYKDCEVNDNTKNKFKNDLFVVSAINDLLRTTCSSGRQSRCYIITNNKMSRGNLIAGKEIADDCFVSDFYKNEEDLSYYVGSCNKGNGEYGKMIYYNGQYSGKNGYIPENFGEKISNNSFCVLSSAVPLSLKENDLNKFLIYDGIIHPMCYPMFCSSRSLTINIYDQYVVCPREGGIVEIKGNYKGHIYCPDYNLICTGTVMCNDMFDCIEKHSLEKSGNFEYDYEIKTSQEKNDKEIFEEDDISIGYELSDEEIGKCPQYCNQCRENKQCFICKENFILIGVKEGDDNPIYCVENADLERYYKKEGDNTYYLCPDNCLSCSAKDQCNNCQDMYKLNNNNSSCIEIVPNCKILDINNERCEECNDNFYMINDDRYHCYNDTIDLDKYFTEDDGKIYISCDKAIENCEKCKNRDECLLCKNGYIYNEKSKACKPEISSCKIYDINYDFCENCEEGFYFLDDDKLHCYNDTLDEGKYFTEDEGKTYISCNKSIDNCEKCDNREKCNKCQRNYKLSNNHVDCIYFEIFLDCHINVHYLENVDLRFLEEENIQNLVENYEKTYAHYFGQVEHYINEKNNFTVTIYTLDNCTKDLLNYGAYSLNTNNILENYIEERLIICFITYNFKNYINFFENDKKVDIEAYYDLKVLKYNLKNNYTNSLNNYYSPLLVGKIIEEDIDIFSIENENLDDKCNSFEIAGIDLPVEIREKLFFNFNDKQKFICTDMNCQINSNDNQNSISNCDCFINNNFNYLFSENKNDYANINVQTLDKKINLLDYVKCIFKNFNTKSLFSQFSFYLIIVCILLEIICFIIFLSLKQPVNFEKYLKPNTTGLCRQDTQENKNILSSEEIPKIKSSERNPIGNPPKKISIKYKYKWLNKPMNLNLENNHDEDLEIQSRDEADIENQQKRKIKIYPFNDNDSSIDSSLFQDSLNDTRDKKTDNNKITIPIEKEKLQIKNNIITEQNQNNKGGILPQIITREQNARRKVRMHSIKNTQKMIETIQTAENKVKFKSPIEIYCDTIFIKQHLINLFSCQKNLEKESFIPKQMQIIRFIFLIILNIFINFIFLDRNYLQKKYYYFNNKYNLEHEAEKDFKISTEEKIKYSLNNCIINALISFVICFIIEIIIGILFFNTKKKVDNSIEFNKIMMAKNDNSVLKKIKCLFILFFFLNFILIIIFCLFLLGFNIINSNSETDFLIPSLVTFLLLQIIPFLTNIIITIIMYFGLKNDNKKMINIGKTFLF